HQGQEDARALRCCASHADSSPDRADRRVSQPSLYPRLRCRSAERDRAREETGLIMAETTNSTLKAAAFTAGGTERERADLPVDLFDGTINMPVMHQAVKAYLSNQRLGLAYTKTRGLVTGGNQKPWKQKGTGRARQGSRRAPHLVGGVTVFGPTGRKYVQEVPRQIRALARKSALNARARED